MWLRYCLLLCNASSCPLPLRSQPCHTAHNFEMTVFVFSSRDCRLLAFKNCFCFFNEFHIPGVSPRSGPTVKTWWCLLNSWLSYRLIVECCIPHRGQRCHVQEELCLPWSPRGLTQFNQLTWWLCNQLSLTFILTCMFELEWMAVVERATLGSQSPRGASQLPNL